MCNLTGIIAWIFQTGTGTIVMTSVILMPLDINSNTDQSLLSTNSVHIDFRRSVPQFVRRYFSLVNLLSSLIGVFVDLAPKYFSRSKCHLCTLLVSHDQLMEYRETDFLVRSIPLFGYRACFLNSSEVIESRAGTLPSVPSMMLWMESLFSIAGSSSSATLVVPTIMSSCRQGRNICTADARQVTNPVL